MSASSQSPSLAKAFGLVLQVASMLQVEQYGIAQVSSHMAAVLPAHWAPPGIGRPAPLSVPWSDGAKVSHDI